MDHGSFINRAKILNYSTQFTIISSTLCCSLLASTISILDSQPISNISSLDLIISNVPSFREALLLPSIFAFNCIGVTKI